MNCYYIMEYLPTRYSATTSQISDRQAVYNFKDGYCNPKVLNGLADGIRQIAGYCKSDYVILFVPASTSYKTSRRYSKVCARLQEITGVKASLSGITKMHDSEAGHIAGKTSDPASDFSFNSSIFRGKKVILIDDVITRGNTLSSTAARLISNGAASVTGLVVAKTVNPDWSGADYRPIFKIAC